VSGWDVFLKSGEPQLADGEKHARAAKKNTNSVEKIATIKHH
jgi:hypothetical protein